MDGPCFRGARGWPAWLGFLFLALAHAALAYSTAVTLEVTADESTYLNSGRIIRVEGWQQPIVRLHGPLPYYLNQLFVGDFPEGGYPYAENPERLLLRSRLGTLPASLLGLLLAFLWSRRLFGSLGGLLTTAFLALNPLSVAFAGLLAVDCTHATAVLFCLWCCWRACLRPSPLRLALTGTSLGLALATKYIACLIAPGVWIACMVASWREGRDGPRLQQALRLTTTTLLLIACTLVTLHACYGFDVGFAPHGPAQYTSERVAWLAGLPVLGEAIALAPEPWVLGIDYQVRVSERGSWVGYLDGVLAQGHATYYLRAFLYKTPELVLAAALWLVVARLPRWLFGTARREERSLAWVAVLALGPLLAYISVGTALQIGIRYALPLYPVLFVMLGALATAGLFRQATPRGTGAVRAGLALLVVVAGGAQALREAGGDPLGYFNRASGGQVLAYRRLIDGSADWSQLAKTGPARLRASAPELVVLSPDDGPRFGTLAVRALAFAHRDPEHPERPRHWLSAFEPSDHAGATWFRFDVTREAFAQAARNDPRVRQDHVVALLGEGLVSRAAQEAAALPDPRRERLEPLFAAARAEALGATGASATPRTPAETLQLAAAWAEVARWDHVERLAGQALAAPNAWQLLASALTLQGRYDEAIAFLARRDEPQAAVSLAALHAFLHRFDRAVAILERIRPRLAPELTEHVDGMLVELRARWRAEHAFRTVLGPPPPWTPQSDRPPPLPLAAPPATLASERP